MESFRRVARKDFPNKTFNFEFEPPLVHYGANAVINLAFRVTGTLLDSTHQSVGDVFLNSLCIKSVCYFFERLFSATLWNHSLGSLFLSMLGQSDAIRGKTSGVGHQHIVPTKKPGLFGVEQKRIAKAITELARSTLHWTSGFKATPVPVFNEWGKDLPIEL